MGFYILINTENMSYLNTLQGNQKSIQKLNITNRNAFAALLTCTRGPFSLFLLLPLAKCFCLMEFVCQGFIHHNFLKFLELSTLQRKKLKKFIQQLFLKKFQE